MKHVRTSVGRQLIDRLEDMKKYFRSIGWAEGASLLVLLAIAMPIKYLAGIPEPTKVVGAIHGLLFLAYNAVAFVLKEEENWSNRKLMTAFVLSCVPFGTFIFESRYRRR